MPARRVRGRFKQKQANEDLRLDTDVLIFDRITYDATRALLDHAKDQSVTSKLSKPAVVALDDLDSPDSEYQIMEELPERFEDLVKTVDAFHTIFVTAHGVIDELTAISSHNLESELQILHFRLLLLRLTVLFVARHASSDASPSEPALARLRHANQMRAVRWGANVGPGIRVFPAEVLKWYRSAADNGQDEANEDAEMLDAQSDPQEAEFEDDMQSFVPPRLADILPFFIQLTALRSAEDETWHTSERWLRLAADFMRQAVLERMIEPDSTSKAADSIIVEAFAWGVEGVNDTQLDIRDENTVFLLADEKPDQATTTWSKLRTRYLNELLPKNASATEEAEKSAITRAHLESLKKRHPLDTFEKQLLSFVEALTASYPQPILSQLEADGTSNEASDNEEGEENDSRTQMLNGELVQVDEREALRKILYGRAQ